MPRNRACVIVKSLCRFRRYPTPGGPNTSGGTGATYLSMNVSGSDAANFMTGQFVTPQFVTDQAMAAQYSSYGRTQQSANMQVPGLTVA